jgi:O-antigen ligase
MTATVLSGVAHWRAIRNRRAKILRALSMAASVYFAIMADSRSETAAAIVACTANGIWKYRWRAVRVLAIVVVLAMAVLPFVNPQYLNRDLATATGRTEAWAFELQMIEAKPIFGYGYQVEGEIFQSRYWTNWQDFWSHGANTALHNGYISLAIGLGIPGLLLWFIPFFAPWWAILRSKRDPWSMKPLFFLAAVPILLELPRFRRRCWAAVTSLF